MCFDRWSLCSVCNHQASALDELREAAFVVRLEVLRPVVPVVVALPRQRDAVEGRVVHPDDGARGGGRPVAGGGEPVHVQGPVAELRELEGGGGADDAGPDDDGVVLVLRARQWRRLLRCAMSACPCANRLDPDVRPGEESTGGSSAESTGGSSAESDEGARAPHPTSERTGVAWPERRTGATDPGAPAPAGSALRAAFGRRGVRRRVLRCRSARFAARRHPSTGRAASPLCPARLRSRNRAPAPAPARAGRASSTGGRWVRCARCRRGCRPSC